MVRAATRTWETSWVRFACMPSNLSDGFFKNKQAIDDAFVATNAVDEDGCLPDVPATRPDTKYYIHVDLAQKHDYCAVAMAHVDKWVDVKIGGRLRGASPGSGCGCN